MIELIVRMVAVTAFGALAVHTLSDPLPALVLSEGGGSTTLVIAPFHALAQIWLKLATLGVDVLAFLGLA